ncbi:radical SAM protein [Streptomyces sp. XD-27]|uniref:radical SAM protein n=1 Tax=Streptomyces sp. XD-27 TaxID=3062779 RepID=UPI0026F43458|nr:hypothetical protein [Streptomyces sp. XD-27]WKX74575.1 hypothetical protein Q3Y56_02775 [Streptomyces sp. XD-27]
MSRDGWFSVLDQAAGLGVRMVQYIGGEPTLHPYLPQLIDRAMALGMRVEVFSNLVHVRPSMRHAFDREGVTLATSYYSRHTSPRPFGGASHLRASIVHVLDGQTRTVDVRSCVGLPGRIRRRGPRVGPGHGHAAWPWPG